ncbi:MAG: hypothetical protein GTN65_08050, partial [Armatimonadetes bacterium]|nr:hypothetical protein [Armatimonadota bacterium]NIO97038.1 hypothetical protein [Armatimonadota bacterium]
MSSKEDAASIPSCLNNRRAVNWMKDANEVDTALQALKHEDRRVRRRAARTLGELGAPKAVTALLQALHDVDKTVRRNAAEALDRLGWEPQNEPEHVAYLMAKGAWEEIRGLGEGAVGPLYDAVQAVAPELRLGAVEALKQRKDPRAVGPLCQALQDDHAPVRISAAEALGELGDARAVPCLIDVLNASYHLQKAAIAALVAIGDPAIEPLCQALRAEDWELRRGASKALSALDWWSEEETDQLYFRIAQQDWEAVATYGDLAIAPLLRLLKEEWDPIRVGAPKALGELRGPQVVPRLLQALQDPDSWVRMGTAKALGAQEDARAIGPLIQVLGDVNEWVQEEAKEALVVLGKPAVLPLVH